MKGEFNVGSSVKETARELLRGAIDIHLHSSPCLHERILDEEDLALEARGHGMRAYVSKSIYTINADRMYFVSKRVSGFHCFGGVVLNPSVGGLNPRAVEVAIKYGGKEVWMPSIFSKAHLDHFGESYPSMRPVVKIPKGGISVLDEAGNLVPQMDEILDMIAEANIILGTSHLSYEETKVLVDRARQRGVKKILITHPHNEVPNLTLEQQVELASKGAILEHCFLPATTMFYNASIDDIVAVIRAVGPQKCVMATDYGQVFNPSPVEGLRDFVAALLNRGVAPDDIETMVKKNPARLLDLD